MKTHFEVRRTLKGDLCHSPQVSLVTRETPDGCRARPVLQ